MTKNRREDDACDAQSQTRRGLAGGGITHGNCRDGNGTRRGHANPSLSGIQQQGEGGGALADRTGDVGRPDVSRTDAPDIHIGAPAGDNQTKGNAAHKVGTNHESYRDQEFVCL